MGVNQVSFRKKVNNPTVAVLSQVEYSAPRHRVGIMGGTFNPVHNGHLMIAEQVRSQLDLDKVVFVPDNEPPHVDRKTAIAGTDRLAMLRRAVADHPQFAVSDMELVRGGRSYTIDTIRELRQRHPENDYYFIIGGDMVAYLPKWYQIDELVKLVTFVGVVRPGYERTSAYPITWVDVPEFAVSSTLIRRLVKTGGSIKYLVPESVREYIEEKGLYRE